MPKAYFIPLILFLYFLALLQTSFLAHFPVFGIVPDLLLIFIVFLNVLQPPEENSGFLAAFIAGFFLDIYSGGLIGIQIFIFLAITFALKFFLKKYVRLSAV